MPDRPALALRRTCWTTASQHAFRTTRSPGSQSPASRANPTRLRGGSVRTGRYVHNGRLTRADERQCDERRVARRQPDRLIAEARTGGRRRAVAHPAAPVISRTVRTATRRHCPLQTMGTVTHLADLLRSSVIMVTLRSRARNVGICSDTASTTMVAVVETGHRACSPAKAPITQYTVYMKRDG